MMVIEKEAGPKRMKVLLRYSGPKNRFFGLNSKRSYHEGWKNLPLVYFLGQDPGLLYFALPVHQYHISN